MGLVVGLLVVLPLASLVLVGVVGLLTSMTGEQWQAVVLAGVTAVGLQLVLREGARRRWW